MSLHHSNKKRSPALMHVKNLIVACIIRIKLWWCIYISSAGLHDVPIQERGYSITGRDDALMAAERAKALERAYFEQQV